LAALGGVVATTSIAWAADIPVKAPATAAPAAAVQKTWSIVLDSEVRYSSWRSNLSFPASVADPLFRGGGSQLYIPYALQVVAQPNENFKVELVGRGGWVSARQTSGDRSGSVDTTTDTAVSGVFTYLGIPGIQPFVAVNFNVPTGRPALFGSAANARMDPDLVDIASFGEGLNIGPTVGFNLPIGSNWIATLSVGYTERGKYQREGSQDPTVFPAVPSSTVDPGEDITGTASLGYQEGPFAGAVTGTVSAESKSKVDGEPISRAGMRYLVAGNFAYTWPDTWGVTTLNASFARAERNLVLFVLPAGIRLDAEPFNSNSNLYRVGLEHLFAFGNLLAGPIGSFLYRDRNSYDPRLLQFVSAKERWTAGFLARYAATDHLSFSARVEHIWVHEQPGYPENPFSLLTDSFIPGPPAREVSSTGWQAAFGATVRM
jgi:hypothetical protein